MLNNPSIMMFQCFSYAGGSQFHHELRCTTWNSLAGDDTTSSSRLRLTLLLCALSLGPMSAIGKQEYLDEMTYRQIASNSTDSALFETLKDTVLGYSWCQWRSFRICTQKSRFFLVSEFGTRLAPEAYRTYPVRGDLY